MQEAKDQKEREYREQKLDELKETRRRLNLPPDILPNSAPNDSQVSLVASDPTVKKASNWRSSVLERAGRYMCTELAAMISDW